jgi:hypothetical protein
MTFCRICGRLGYVCRRPTYSAFRPPHTLLYAEKARNCHCLEEQMTRSRMENQKWKIRSLATVS